MSSVPMYFENSEPEISKPSFWESIGVAVSDVVNSAANIWEAKQGNVLRSQDSLTAGAAEQASSQKQTTMFLWIALFILVVVLASGRIKK